MSDIICIKSAQIVIKRLLTFFLWFIQDVATFSPLLFWPYLASNSKIDKSFIIYSHTLIKFIVPNLSLNFKLI